MDVETSLEAFEAIFRAHYDELLRFAVRRVGPDAAADVVADAFLVAWRRRADIPAEAARLWLFGVAGNLIKNERRGQLRRARLLRRVAAETISADSDSAEDERSGPVAAAFETLSEADREALRLTEWEQLSAAEAAIVLGCSAAAFRVRLHRARRRLANAVVVVPTSIPTNQGVIA
jgi:RNA polymerase sigma-70 factor (ECF subfamily)